MSISFSSHFNLQQWKMFIVFLFTIIPFSPLFFLILSHSHSILYFYNSFANKQTVHSSNSLTSVCYRLGLQNLMNARQNGSRRECKILRGKQLCSTDQGLSRLNTTVLISNLQRYTCTMLTTVWNTIAIFTLGHSRGWGDKSSCYLKTWHSHYACFGRFILDYL